MASLTAALGVQGTDQASVHGDDIRAQSRRRAQDRRPRIVGGQPVVEFTYPFVVGLLESFSTCVACSHVCGASLIAPQWALTAAHCITVGRVYTVLVHAHDLARTVVDDECTELVGVQQVMCHPQYDSSTDANDVCLLKLAAPARCGAALRDAGLLPKLDRSPTAVSAGVLATTAGWGALETDGAYPSVMQEVALPLIPTDACRRQYWGSYIFAGMLCAGYPQGGRDSCQGDSGGPLWVAAADGSGVVQVGVVSWGGDCAAQNAPGVYAEVATYYDWILSHVPELAAPPPSPQPPFAPPAFTCESPSTEAITAGEGEYCGHCLQCSAHCPRCGE